MTSLKTISAFFLDYLMDDVERFINDSSSYQGRWRLVSVLYSVHDNQYHAVLSTP